MKNIYLVIVLYSFLTNSTIANNNTTVYLNSGDSIQTNITDVQSWGIKISDGRSISHNVIFKIITDNQELISQFKQRFQESVITNNDMLYTIKFPKTTIVSIPHHDRKFLVKFYVNAFYMFNKDELFELQFVIAPKHTGNIMFKLSTSITWEEDTRNVYRIVEEANSYLNIFSAGVGYNIEYDPINILFFLNYADKTFFDDDASKIFEDISFIYPSISFFFGYEKVKFIIGSQYYFNYVSKGKNTPKLSFKLGMGYII